VLARQGGNDVVVHGVDNNYIDRGGCKVAAAKCRQSIRAQRVTLDSPPSVSPTLSWTHVQAMPETAMEGGKGNQR
jgi:hypothetical protein